jgi:hypothetical protein
MTGIGGGGSSDYPSPCKIIAILFMNMYPI